MNDDEYANGCWIVPLGLLFIFTAALARLAWNWVMG